MSNLLSVSTVNPSGQTRRFVVPPSQCLVYLEDPSPLGLRSPLGFAGAAVLNKEKSSVILYPFLSGVFYGSKLLQNPGEYEIPNGGAVNFKGYSWRFRYVTAEEGSKLPAVSASATSKGDMMAGLTEVAGITGLPIFAGTFNLANMGKRCLPLWLPGCSDGVPHPQAAEDRHMFFAETRIPSSLKSTVAVTYPYGPAPKLASNAEKLPVAVSKIHVFVRKPEQAVVLNDCLMAISKLPSIKAALVDYGVMDVPSSHVKDWEVGTGHLTSFIWPFLRDELGCSIVIQVLRANPNLEHLTIGGSDDNLLQVLRSTARWDNLKSLSIYLTSSEHPEEIIELLAHPPDERVFNLESISLTFNKRPCACALLGLFTELSSSLRSISLNEYYTQPHGTCSEQCSMRMFPAKMPLLEKVSFINLTCSGSAVGQAIALNQNLSLELLVAPQDPFKLSVFVGCRQDPPVPCNVTSLRLFNCAVVTNLIFNEAVWGGLKEVHLSKVALKDLPLVLMLGRSAENMTLEVEYSDNNGNVRGSAPVDFRAIGDDYVFLGNGSPWNALRHCSNLRKLRIFFKLRPGDAFAMPTLDSSFFDNGLAHLPHLQWFSANSISRKLLMQLDSLAERTPGFSFRVTQFTASSASADLH